MATLKKIKINDDDILREELDLLFEKATQNQVASWAIEIATHILQEYAPQFLNNEIIYSGFLINQKWQDGAVRMYDARQVGFRIHRLAKSCEDKLHN